MYYVILVEEQVCLVCNELPVHKSNWIHPISICLGVITVVEISFKKIIPHKAEVETFETNGSQKFFNWLEVK
jgi:hypothetical protein